MKDNDVQYYVYISGSDTVLPCTAKLAFYADKYPRYIVFVDEEMMYKWQ